MNPTLKHLYEALNVADIMKNPFRSTEINMSIDWFLNEHFRSIDEADNANAELDRLHEMIQQKAFQVGFYTAIELMLK